MLGGTFNPPHRGHLALAASAREQLGLDSVALMPARSSPLKPAGPDPGAEHRLRMCELAVASAPGLRACGLELKRDAPSYTVDTLDVIHASDPQLGLTLIMGADTAGTLNAWREPDRILGLARLAVAERPGAQRAAVLAALERAADGAPAPQASFLKMEPLEISSSQVRARVQRGESVGELVGEAVARYIAEHGLYADEAAGS